MSSILLTAPAVEALSLDEAKAYLRVEHNDDDEVIAALITQSWRISTDGWPQRRKGGEDFGEEVRCSAWHLDCRPSHSPQLRRISHGRA